MKKATAVVLVLASIPFFTFGIIFLIAMITSPGRGLVALVLLASATALLVSGVRTLRRLAALDPAVLRTQAVEMAKRMGGELTVSQLRAEYRISQELATQILDDLVREGSCKPEQREERVVYVFTGLLPALAEKVCPYCGSKLPVRSALRKCPNCGAGLEVSKT